MKKLFLLFTLFFSLAAYSQKFGIIASSQQTTVAHTYDNFNPADKEANLTLSLSNTRMAGCGCIGAQMVRGTQGKSTGKHFYEATVTSGGSVQIGVAKSTENLSAPVGGGVGGYSYLDGGDKYNNNTTAFYGSGYTTGDVIGVALDLTAGTIAFYKNGVALGTAYTGLTGTFYLAVGTNWSPATVTINTGATAFAYSVPSGFNAGWYN